MLRLKSTQLLTMRAFLIRLQKSSGNAVSEREERQKEELRKM